MRPIKLTMQAFGPFAGTEVIDFARLGSNPLFLINGQTGSGKSTILDAICFSLYGQTTGAERDGSQMRCDHSDRSVLTEVSLEFELGNKRYYIRRVPTQERAKSRGDGFTPQSSEAQLKELDGSDEGRLIVSKSVLDANNAVKQLIGLGVEQFRQVMVLPQGKFRELLMAASKDREAIFSQLFETHIYKKIENKLKEKAGDISQKVAAHEGEIKGVLQAADVSTEDELNKEYDLLNKDVEIAKEQKELTENTLKQAQRIKDEAEALVKRFETLTTKEQEKFEIMKLDGAMADKKLHLQQAEKAHSIYHFYKSQKTADDKLTDLDKKLQHSREVLLAAQNTQKTAVMNKERATEAASALDDLKSEKSELDRLGSVNQKLVIAKNNCRESKAELEKSEDSLKGKKHTLDLLANEITDKRLLVEQLNQELESFSAAKLEQESLSQKMKECKARDQLKQELANVQVKRDNANSEVESKQGELEKAKHETLTTEMLWHLGQASLLAQQLEDDQPCPVCGSVEHPEPAHINEAAIVTKEDVDERRAQENEVFILLQESKDVLATLNSQLEVLKSNLQVSQNKLGQDAHKTLEEITATYAKANQNVASLEAKKAKAQCLTKRITEIQDIQIASKSELSKLEERANHDKQAATIAETRFDQLQEQIPEEFRLPGTLHNRIQEVADQIQKITDQLEIAENAFKESQSTLDKTVSIETMLSEQLGEQKKQTEEAVKEWHSELQNSDFDGVTEFLDARLDDSRQKQLRSELEIYHSEMVRINAVIIQLNSELQNKEKPDVSLIDKTLIEATSSFQEKDDYWRKLEARLQHLGSLREKLKAAHKISKELAQEYAVMGTLSEVANGTSGQKVSFQRFVLSVLLDDVLIQASQRLLIMSKGRYQLVRKVDKTKGNKASGLELEVEDGNTGKSRSVATLSGGESFMAALSLALGLSDVVQSYAGGIKLDTLFIDEGFGSLDMESLDAALQVLIDLQLSGRMIGIISHVTELKEQMALRIDVVGGRFGSHVKTVAA